MMSNGLWQPYNINIIHTNVYNHAISNFGQINAAFAV